MAAPPPAKKKFHFENGRMVIDLVPDDATAATAPAAAPIAAVPAPSPTFVPLPAGPTVANPARALACVCSVEDTKNVAAISGLPVPQPTQNTFDVFESTPYVAEFGCGDRLNGQQLLGDLSKVFETYQIPIGLATKLLDLRSFELHFKVDDSGSMGITSSNGKTRWENAEARLHLMIDLIQFVPTGPIRISFMNHSHSTHITRGRETPAEFATKAHGMINHAFRHGPSGGTPIYKSVHHMLSFTSGSKRIAHYLFTDGEPNGYEREKEIADTANLIIGRSHPKENPFTFLCCSDDPNDTMWMHEIEEMACRPGRPGFVAAQQNFQAERTEVLNDQGPEFPYSYSMWLLCNLTAALNPNDLDALDQHAPLTKPTMESLMGRSLTEVEYLSYFNQHPNARWVFWEDYAGFLTTPIACTIPSVNLFDTTLAGRLALDINSGDDTSENRALGYTEDVVLTRLGRQRPMDIRIARADYWRNHCLQMERAQPIRANQDLWGDYLAWRNLGSTWGGFQQQQQQQQPSDGAGGGGAGGGIQLTAVQGAGGGAGGGSTLAPLAYPEYYRGYAAQPLPTQLDPTIWNRNQAAMGNMYNDQTVNNNACCVIL